MTCCCKNTHTPYTCWKSFSQLKSQKKSLQERCLHEKEPSDLSVMLNPYGSESDCVWRRTFLSQLWMWSKILDQNYTLHIVSKLFQCYHEFRPFNFCLSIQRLGSKWCPILHWNFIWMVIQAATWTLYLSCLLSLHVMYTFAFVQVILTKQKLFFKSSFHRWLKNIDYSTGGKHKACVTNSALHLVLSSLAPCFYPAAALSSLPLVKE